MHDEILTPAQHELLPVVHAFAEDFGLVGGTAIALHLGHRESIDFDLFTEKDFDNQKIKQKLKRYGAVDRIIRDETGQLTLIAHDVHMTFFQYPYPIAYDMPFGSCISVPSLLTLGAMKLFALGRRAKWKDYVDLYFILKTTHTLDEIISESMRIFGVEFNEKIVREQLSYFADINYTEQVVFRPGCETDEQVIKDALTEWSLS